MAFRRIVLIGNPNCGKTTLFNELTGAQQRIGNWSGVTVERKSGLIKLADQSIEIIDLPGVYSLVVTSSAIDERIASDYILSHAADMYVNVVDASHLQRHLYLTAQLLEMDVPLIVAVNMLDLAQRAGKHLDLDALSTQLGCPVIGLEAHRSKGIEALKQQLSRGVQQTTRIKLSDQPVEYPEQINKAVAAIQRRMSNYTKALALQLLEGGLFVNQAVTAQEERFIKEQKAQIADIVGCGADVVIASARYSAIQVWLKTTEITLDTAPCSVTTKLDNLLLSRWFGLPFFFLIMYCLFVFSINIGGLFKDFFDITGQAFFVDGVATFLQYMSAPPWLIAILAMGAGKGIATTISFIPIIGAMFLFLSLLESSGYMARAAFVMDRMMQSIGLPGKSFVPMIVGFGCNVPAILGARTVDNPRDRVLTILMSPFMSCGARLAIYVVFVSAFFPQGGAKIVFLLYLIGILMAVLTGYVLRSTLLKGNSVSSSITELPPYHLPNHRVVLRQTGFRLKGFLFKAGKVIVPVCMLIGALNVLTIHGTLSVIGADSLLAKLGQLLTPLFAPMGIHADNWPATVGLLTGVLAKEVVVATLNTLYSQLDQVVVLQTYSFNGWAQSQLALHSILDNISHLGTALMNPVSASVTAIEIDQSVFGRMYQSFDGKIGAFAYLLFVLLYFPCVSATAAVARELNRTWAWFAVLWSTSIAYGTAVIFYQLATALQHPIVSVVWCIGLATVFSAIYFVICRYIQSESWEITTQKVGCMVGCDKKRGLCPRF